MVEHLTIEEILKLNPRIDKEEIEKRIEILNKFCGSKTEGIGYNLALPFTNRHVFLDEDSDVDSRTICLKRPR